MAQEPVESVYAIGLTTIDGNDFFLDQYRGKKILLVNVASECGQTPQYAGLQELYEAYRDELVVIGLPCNQFGKQEPGTEAEIREFCETNYGVTFPLTEKIEVKGPGQHPLYGWLTSKSRNGLADSEVKWNFYKYLLDEEGRLIAGFSSKVKPMDEEIVGRLGSAGRD